MKNWIDYYETLQVHPNACKDVIKAAYRKLTTINHPDVCKKPFSEENMKKINLAYEVLIDDNRRRIFHESWIENINSGKREDPSSNRYKKKQPTKEQLKALECLELYFECLERKDFISAYKYITTDEKKYIRERDFVEWQEAVAKVIEISKVEIREFKKHCDFESQSGGMCFNAYEFEVSLLEKNNITCKIAPNSFTKIVLKEKNEYFVLVGYDNLRPVINKFNAMYAIKEKKGAMNRFQEMEAKYDTVTGLMNKRGFLEEAKKEEIRFKRYGHVFSIIFIDCSCVDLEAKGEEISEFIVGIIKKNIRKLDILAKWGKETFVLLLPETEASDAEIVAEKLKMKFSDTEICVGQKIIKIKLKTGVSEYNRHSLMETVYKAQVEKKSKKNGSKGTKNVI
ncbi:MAG: hypothetical protein C0604_06005 [Clostridiales bacterium]|nr:MAG: hypothetical protein C0604_06005 [Clostridiales bacterium]